MVQPLQTWPHVSGVQITFQQALNKLEWKVIDQVWTLIMQNHRVTNQELLDKVRISTGSVHSILRENLAMWSVSTKFTLNCSHSIWFRLSWPNKTFPRFIRPPVFPKWLLLVLGYSPSWKCHSRQPLRITDIMHNMTTHLYSISEEARPPGE